MSYPFDKLNEVALSLFGPTFANDRVFIMENMGFSQAFPDARPLNLRVNSQANIAKHILEDGSTISDHLVMDALSIEMNMIFIRGFRNTYAQIKAAFEEGRLFTIQTKTHTYTNMVITALPYEENTDYWDVIQVNLKFEEARFVLPERGTLNANEVANASDASTINRGSQ